MSASPRWRLLACAAAPEADSGNAGVFSALLDLAAIETQLQNVQVSVLHNPSLPEFKDAVAAHRPNLVYCCGTSSSTGMLGPFQFRDAAEPGEAPLLSALAEAQPEVAYMDAAVSPHFGPSLHHRGTAHVVVWPADAAIPAAVASYFTAAFLAVLINSAASPPEAFAAASHGAQAHCVTVAPVAAPTAAGGQQDASAAAAGSGGSGNSPPLPAFVSAVRPGLPDSSSIPAVVVPGLTLEQSRLPSFPGWSDVRLLAPRAELRMLLVGGCSLIDSTRLSFLGEALRALLVLEVRSLQLVSTTPLDLLPRTLPSGCTAVRCRYVTASGASGVVVLGAPPAVLQHEGLVQHALRMTLLADSVSLQFRLPPPGLSLPAPRASRAVAGGLPVVDCVAGTSVWAVEVLRALCREPRYRSLAALGVAAVGNLADAAFTAADVRRMEVLVSGTWGAAAEAAPLLAMSGSEPAPAETVPLPAGEVLPSPAAPPPQGGGNGPLDLTAAAASGGAFFGNDALMGYALNGHLQHLAGGGSAAAPDGTAGATAAASPDSPEGGGAAGGSDGLGGAGTEPMDASPDGAGLAFGSGGEPGSRGPGRPAGPLSNKRPNFTGDLPGYTCRRPPLSCCSESQFYDDLVDFLSLLRGRPIDRARFPEAVLNGVALDLFSLYREVVTRGGFRVGNGINWKGQVFPRMRNWTETNKQTGVGNALKRHYQNYLWEYEVAHPEDVTLDRCVLCNGGDGVACDWVCCDTCENWAHFSCDKRPGIGAFKDYATGGPGRVYVCPSCAREQAAGEAVKRQRTA